MTEAKTEPALPAVRTDLGGDILSSPQLFEHTWRVARAFAASAMVPVELQGSPENCLVALDMARTMRENPLIVMQNIYFVHGRSGFSAQYMISRANKSEVLKGRIGWRVEGEGDGLTVTAYATLADTGKEITSTCSMKMARDEGWTKNTKYKSMPEHMLRYRSATFLIRLYMPEVMFGMNTSDELDDMHFAGTLTTDADGTYAPAPPRPIRAEPRDSDEVISRAVAIADRDGISTEEALILAREEESEAGITDVDEGEAAKTDAAPETGDIPPHLQRDVGGGFKRPAGETKTEPTDEEDPFGLATAGTGQAMEVPTITAPMLEGNLPDYKAFAGEMIAAVGSAPTIAWLDELLANHETLLADVFKLYPESKPRFEKHVAARRKALGAVQKAAE